MPEGHEKWIELISVSMVKQERMWIGILENGKLNLFNLRHITIQKSLNVKNDIRSWKSRNGHTLSNSDDRVLVCVFDCPNPNRLYSYDFSHRLARSNNPANFQIVGELERHGFFKAMSKIGADLSGLTVSRLQKVRAGMNFLSQTLQNTAAISYDPGFAGGVFVARL